MIKERELVYVTGRISLILALQEIFYPSAFCLLTTTRPDRAATVIKTSALLISHITKLPPFTVAEIVIANVLL